MKMINFKQGQNKLTLKKEGVLNEKFKFCVLFEN